MNTVYDKDTISKAQKQKKPSVKPKGLNSREYREWQYEHGAPRKSSYNRRWGTPKIQRDELALLFPVNPRISDTNRKLQEISLTLIATSSNNSLARNKNNNTKNSYAGLLSLEKSHQGESKSETFLEFISRIQAEEFPRQNLDNNKTDTSNRLFRSAGQRALKPEKRMPGYTQKGFKDFNKLDWFMWRKESVQRKIRNKLKHDRWRRSFEQQKKEASIATPRDLSQLAIDRPDLSEWVNLAMGNSPACTPRVRQWVSSQVH